MLRLKAAHPEGHPQFCRDNSAGNGSHYSDGWGNIHSEDNTQRPVLQTRFMPQNYTGVCRSGGMTRTLEAKHFCVQQGGGFANENIKIAKQFVENRSLFFFSK